MLHKSVTTENHSNAETYFGTEEAAICRGRDSYI